MARVKKLTIRNLLAFEELEFEPGQVTLIEGANAEGKTSILEVVDAILGGGHDATLLRKGEEEGEGVLVIEDPGGDFDGVEIRKRVTPERSTLDVTHPRLGKVSAAQTFVNGLHDAIAVNPVRFILSDNRAELLLEALETEVASDDLREAIGDVDPGEVPVDDLIRGVEGLPAPDAIDRVHKAVYNARTGVNRVVREKETTAAQLRETIPEDVGDVDALEKELGVAESAVEELREEQTKERDLVATATATAVEDIARKRDERVSELQAQIAAVREEAEEEIAAAKEEREAKLQQIRQEYEPRITETREEAATLREKIKAAENVARTRSMIEQHETTAEEHAAQSEAMTAALDRLDALRANLLDELPIDGAEITDGEIYVDGIPFDRLNSAKKAEIILGVAELRAGDLGLVCVDDLEMLDSEHFEAVVSRLRESPLQAFVTRVSDDALTIRTLDEDDDADEGEENE